MTTRLRDGRTVDDARLDRLPSTVTEHLERYPLTAALPDQPVPVVAGVNWYSGLDDPQWRVVNGKGRWVLGGGPLGRLRGGHAVCLAPLPVTDLSGWRQHYNQGQEGRCVEFACLRAMSLLNRRRYDVTSRWHYWQAQYADEWLGGSYPGAEPQYEGTSVRAGLEVLRQHGAIRALRGGRPVRVPFVGGDGAYKVVRPEDGISAYRWCRTWDEVRFALGVPGDQYGVPLLNSWGEDTVFLLDDATGARLLAEDGEFGVPTDR